MNKSGKYDLEERLLDETEELIKIFVSSIKTAEMNKRKQ